jgi:hypothetical protein
MIQKLDNNIYKLMKIIQKWREKLQFLVIYIALLKSVKVVLKGKIIKEKR